MASNTELVDLCAMLTTTGVAPVSDSIASYAQQMAGQKTAGLWSFVASFRDEKRKTKKPGSASTAEDRNVVIVEYVHNVGNKRRRR